MLATAIPDIEPLRIEVNLCFAELRVEMDRRFAGLERRLHAQLICKPFQHLLRVVFILDSDANPEEARPVTLFATDPEMAPERIYRIYRDRFPIEFNSGDAKLLLELAACQARTKTRHHFHVNAVLTALTWTAFRWPTSSSNPKLKSFLQLMLQHLFDTDGLSRTLKQYPKTLQALLQRDFA